MPVFTYTAIDRTGRQLNGTVPAESRAAALDQMISQGLSPVSVDEQGNGARVAAPSTSTRVSQASVEQFTRELANLLAAGLPLARALHLLRREASQPGAKNVWGAIHDDVVGGTSLADSMAKWPKAFSTVYVAMVRAGEAGGFLHVVLQQIADFRTREQDLKGKVKSAMIYPAFLSVFGTLVVIGLLTWFLPKMKTMFDEFGGNLPALTQGIIKLSEILKSYGIYALGVLILIAIAVKRSLDTEAGHRLLERTILATPAVGKIMAHFALVRFSRMLGTLLSGGVPLVASLKVAKEAIGNQTLTDAVGYAIEEVQRGQPLSRSLGASPMLFPPSVVEMVSIAEETGRLDKELIRLSVTYESDLDRNLRMVVSLAEPTLLVIMAAVIGTVIVGMLLPIFNMQELMR